MAVKRIDRALVRSLQPESKPYEVRDQTLPGFLVRVSPSGRKVYVVQYARGRRLNVGRADVLSPSEARERALAVLADHARGIDPLKGTRAERARTLAAYLDGDYGEWASTHYADGDQTVKRIRAAFPELLTVRLDEITPWQVEKWRATRMRRGVSASTLNRQLNPLKALMNRAKQFGVIETNPLEGAAKLKRVDSKGVVRFLSSDEERRLRDSLHARESRIKAERQSANRWRVQRGYPLLPSLETSFADHLLPMVLLSLNTGLRRGEVFNLRRSDIDLGRAMLTVRGEGAKSGETRYVPLNVEALETLQEWMIEGATAEYLFPGEHGGRLTSVRSAWEAVIKDAGIHNFRWHDLRHTFASRLVMAEVNLNTVRELLGHADLKMTIRYAHLAPHVKAEAVSRLAGEHPREPRTAHQIA